MSRAQLLRRGMLIGLITGALFFAADLLGASFAIGSLFDPKWEAFLLVGLAGLLELAAAAAMGALAGASWPRRWRLGLRLAAIVALAVVFCVIVAGVGYGSRVARRLPELDARPAVSAGRPLDVLWITIDTLRADTVYGAQLDFPLTPSLRSFARDALVFADAESAAGWTIPSVATMFTAMYPEALYSPLGYLLPSWAPTVAERLRAAGYATHALVDNALLEPRNGFGDGFESFRQRSALRFAFSLPGLRLLPRVPREILREHLRVFYEGSPGVTDAAIEQLRREHDAPLFLYVHYMDVHYPYYPHPELGPDPAGTQPVNLALAMERLTEDPKDVPTEPQLRFLQHRYANELRALDADLGRLLGAWKDRFGGQSVVIVTSDHGEEFLEHDELGHGHSLYTELVHVPLLLGAPREVLPRPAEGRVVREPVGHVDLMPTLLDLLGVSPEIGAPGVTMQGRSMLAWLQGREPAPQRPLFAGQNRKKRLIYRVREGGWAYLRTEHQRGGTEIELYDKASDYTEQRNEAQARADVASSLQRAMDASVDAQVRARDQGPSDAEGNLDALKALGYVQ